MRSGKKEILIYLALLGLLSILFSSCGRKKDQIPEGKILAKIGDKVVTTDEFIRRAEYTIRPRYCKMDNYIHKKIVFNSILGEKLLAMEADEDNPLRKNEGFQAYIAGRREQAMRQLMYFDEAFDKADVTEDEIREEFKIAGRTYKISYLSLPDSASAFSFKDSLEAKNLTLKEGVEAMGGVGELPTKEVGWTHKEHKLVHQALFKNDVKKDQVIGPLEISEDGYFLYMQVDGWTDSKVITEQSVQQRWEDSKERIQDEKAEVIWVDYVSDLMRGKRMDLVEDTFWKLNEIYFEMYFKTEEEKRDEFNKKFWNKKDTELNLNDIDDEEDIMDYPLLKLDGETWTVRDFKKLVARHPLVFRKRKMSKSEFPQQLKFAIADLIRDKFVTDDAYKKGYDKRLAVEQNAAMWEDAALANYMKNVYLNDIGALRGFKPDDEKKIEQFLNPYVDSLQTKYSDQIEINIEAFEDIKLTRIDMFVTQRDQPYPVVVPSFPLVTTDNRLDYGKKMEK